MKKFILICLLLLGIGGATKSFAQYHIPMNNSLFCTVNVTLYYQNSGPPTLSINFSIPGAPNPGQITHLDDELNNASVSWTDVIGWDVDYASCSGNTVSQFYGSPGPGSNDPFPNTCSGCGGINPGVDWNPSTNLYGAIDIHQ